MKRPDNAFLRPFLIAILFSIILLPCRLMAADEPLSWDPAVIQGKLDNGMTYYIRVNHKPEKRVEIRLMVKAGSLLEEDSTNGIAHFIEHMGFNGTTHFASGELVKYFESIGADWGPDTNAYTTMDHTEYRLTLPVDKPEPLDKGLITMADYASGILFQPEEIEKERGVILSELRMGRDVETRIFEKLVGICLAGTIYPDRLTIGKKENIEKVTKDDFVNFYKKWYRPDRMGITVVGDIDPAAVEKKIKEYFSAIPKPASAEELPIYPDKPHSDIRAGIITDPEMPISASVIVFTRPPTRTYTVSDFRSDLIRTIAFGIYNDRLNEISLAPNPPFKEAGAGEYWSMLGMDIIAIQSTDQMKKEKQALLSLMTEVERIRRFGVLDEEVAEMKKKIGESLRAQAEEKDKLETSNIAAQISNDFLNGEVYMDPVADKDLFDKLKDSITLKDVQDEIERVFAPENMSALFIMPEFQKSAYKEQDILDTIDKARAADIKPYAREKVEKSTDYASLAPGKITDRKTFDDLGVTRVQFENGLRVLLKPTDFQKDEIDFNGFAPGGVLLENYGDRGLARVLFSSLMEGGTTDLTSVQIDRLMSGKTINISAGNREDCSLSGGTVGKDFEETLQWMRDYLTIPGFRDEGVTKAKSLVIDDIKSTQSTQDGLLGISLQQYLCPGNPMAYLPSESDVNAVTADQLRADYAKCASPANTEMTFVGNLDVDKAVALIAKYLGSIPAGAAAPIPEAAKECPPIQGYTRHVIYKGTEERTSIALIFPGPESADADVPAVYAMTKVADIRMNKILREDMSGTYYAYLSPGFNPFIKNRNFIFGGLATTPKRVDEMIDASMKIFKDIADNGPTDEELNSTKAIFAKDLADSLKKNGFWLGALSGKDTVNHPLDLDVQNQKKIQDVTAAQIKEVAKKYLLGDNRIEVIALPEKGAADADKKEPAGK